MAKKIITPKPPVWIPTPKLGETVEWYPQGDLSRAPATAKVTAIEEIGRVSLIIWPPGSNGIPKRNVIFVDHPDKNQRPYTSQYGAFHFANRQVLEHHYDYHKDDYAEREARREADKAAQETRAKLLAERKREQSKAGKTQEPIVA